MLNTSSPGGRSSLEESPRKIQSEGFAVLEEDSLDVRTFTWLSIDSFINCKWNVKGVRVGWLFSVVNLANGTRESARLHGPRARPSSQRGASDRAGMVDRKGECQRWYKKKCGCQDHLRKKQVGLENLSESANESLLLRQGRTGMEFLFENDNSDSYFRPSTGSFEPEAERKHPWEPSMPDGFPGSEKQWDRLPKRRLNSSPSAKDIMKINYLFDNRPQLSVRLYICKYTSC